ncbi:MAG: transglutaminase-like domain-containing protein [Actinomycetota bacterium]|nr:transglutaminase-like domain-containing protein [Actinomycetota bacterium]
MRKNKIITIFVLSAIAITLNFSTSCVNNIEYIDKKESAEEEGEEDLEEIKIPAKTDNTSENIKYSTAFGIDYSHPEKYLSRGEQSTISNPEFLQNLHTENYCLEHLGKIYHWINKNFTIYSAGGRTIGSLTTDQLLEERRLGGCHDYGLVYSSIARELGYPVVMVISDSIEWIKDFQADSKEAELHKGHVFAEVYIDNKWILIDSTRGYYVEDDYFPSDAVIPPNNFNNSGNTNSGYYVECKGIDIWDCNIYSHDDSIESMDKFALSVSLENIDYPDYVFKLFN